MPSSSKRPRLELPIAAVADTQIKNSNTTVNHFLGRQHRPWMTSSQPRSSPLPGKSRTKKNTTPQQECSNARPETSSIVSLSDATSTGGAVTLRDGSSRMEGVSTEEMVDHQQSPMDTTTTTAAAAALARPNNILPSPALTDVPSPANSTHQNSPRLMTINHADATSHRDALTALDPIPSGASDQISYSAPRLNEGETDREKGKERAGAQVSNSSAFVASVPTTTQPPRISTTTPSAESPYRSPDFTEQPAMNSFMAHQPPFQPRQDAEDNLSFRPPRGSEEHSAHDRHTRRPHADVQVRPRQSGFPALAPAPGPASALVTSSFKTWHDAVSERLSSDHGSFDEFSVHQVRYRVLQDACSKNDIFYVVLHQIFCIWTLQKSDLQAVLSIHVLGLKDAFDILSFVLSPNEALPLDHLQWLARFPRDFPAVVEVSPLYRQAMPLVLYFLQQLAQSWPTFRRIAERELRPLLVCELLSLGCSSPTMQSLLFTYSRRSIGVNDNYRKDFNQIFVTDQQNEINFERDGTNFEEQTKRRQHIIASYVRAIQSIPQQALLNNPAHPNAPGQSSPVAHPTGSQLPMFPFPGVRGESGQMSQHRATEAGLGPAAVSTPTSMSPGHLVHPHSSQVQSMHRSHGLHPQANPPQLSAPPASSIPPPVAAQYTTPGHLPQAQQSLPYPAAPRSHGPITSGQRQPTSASVHHQAPQGTVSNVQTQASYQWPLLPPGMLPVFPAYRPSSYPNTVQASQLSPNGHIVGQPTSTPTFQPGRAQQMHPQQSHPPIYLPSQQAYQQQLARLPQAQAQTMRAQVSMPQIPIAIPQGAYPNSQYSQDSLEVEPHLLGAQSPPRIAALFPAGRHYQFIKGFVTGPIEVKPQVGIYELRFNLPCNDMNKLTTRMDSDQGHYCLHEEGSRRFRLRLYLWPSEKEGSKLSECAIARCHWPPSFFVVVNGKYMELRRKKNFSHHDQALELTDSLAKGENSIRISFPKVPENDLKGKKCSIAVEDIETLTHSTLRSRVEKAPRFPKEEMRMKIRRRLQKLDSDDVIIADDFLIVSLADPFSLALCDIPVRGVDCEHLECFDLETWLQTRPSKLVFKGFYYGEGDEPCMVDVWQCPICGRDARPDSLHVDEYLAEIRRKIVDSGETGVTAIKVVEDGTWTKLYEEVNDSEEIVSPANNCRARTESEQRQRLPPNVEIIEIEDD